MKKLLISILIILSIFTLASCRSANSEGEPIDLDNAANMENSQESSQPLSKESTENVDVLKENDADKLVGNRKENDDSQGEKPTFVLKAIVKKIDDQIEVEVIESDYAFGTYIVLTPDTTEYYNQNGSQISKKSISVGDTVEISYSGQTMLSYPPQIVAYSISLVN